ncbi:SpoIID/LytB domain-containing protein [Diplocloster hominis]|uniref:SpoIID/LytB domain-containing protein n=1 Tax=Diplocloster hominis TaxID=3079010 RepID=UPI0031B9B228
MKEKLKNLAAVAVVILLLPYVLTLFISGRDESSVTAPKVRDQTRNEGRTESQAGEHGGTDGIDMEDRVMHIVAKQIPMTYEDEAIKTQAVIARTEVYKEIGEGKDPSASAGTDDLEKLWGFENFTENYDRLKTLVQSTAGQVAIWQGGLIEASFHAVSAGKTRSAAEALGSDQYPYLASVECPKDLESKQFLEIRTYRPDEILDRMREKYPQMEVTEDDLLSQIQIAGTDSAEYVSQLQIGNVTMSGEEFRTLFDLNSSCLSFGMTGDEIRITTKGLGHGLGVSQYQANELAKEGKGYQEILAYFYPGIEVKAYDGTK